MTTFSELSLCPALQANIKSAQFKTPTPVQAAAIPPALAGSDVLATAQTGTGKTLAFLLPVVEKIAQSRATGPQAVVLVPTRELAIQVAENFALLRKGTKIDCAIVVGGLAERPQLDSIRRGAQLIVATPGRLEDFLKRRLIRLGGVTTVVFDEADRMLDMGFLPAIERILKEIPEERQTLCFSATLEASTLPFIRKTLKSPVRVEIGSTAKPAEGVKLQWFEVASDQKVGLLQNLLDQEGGSFLVFARTKHGTTKLARKLSQAGYRAAEIHGNRSQSQRNAALRGFQRGQFRVLVATDVAARGIHVDNIAHVVNFDLPQVPEDFIHRVGRTGRASAEGVASTFATRQESSEIRRLERVLKLKIERQMTPALDPARLEKYASGAPVAEVTRWEPEAESTSVRRAAKGIRPAAERKLRSDSGNGKVREKSAGFASQGARPKKERAAASGFAAQRPVREGGRTAEDATGSFDSRRSFGPRDGFRDGAAGDRVRKPAASGQPAVSKRFGKQPNVAANAPYREVDPRDAGSHHRNTKSAVTAERPSSFRPPFSGKRSGPKDHSFRPSPVASLWP